MSYSDFTLQSIEANFGVTPRPEVLLPDARPAPVPDWLRAQLARGLQLPLVSEKARSELIVMPVLLACRDLSHEAVAIYSGARLDVSPEQGLVGECDFLLARTPPVPELRAPLVAVVEAKKNDVEAGIGQCVAQMVGMRLMNQRAGLADVPVYGCVTTGEVWQFLRLDDAVAAIDRRRYYLDDLEGILGAFQAIVGQGQAATQSGAGAI